MEYSRQDRFNAVQNYALFYGYGHEAELSQFDLVIVEPDGQSESNLPIIHASGTLVLAYLSVMELIPTAPECQLLTTADFLSNQEGLLVNQVYGNYLADLRSKHWLRLLCQKAERLIKSGYDGLFLDTIGDIEADCIPGDVRELQLTAAVNIVGKLRSLFPQHILIQNSGLERLCALTAGYLNGICWENPPFGLAECKPWVDATITKLAGLQHQYGLRVLLLQEEQDAGKDLLNHIVETKSQLAREIAASRGFLLYKAPLDYVGGINLPGSRQK